MPKWKKFSKYLVLNLFSIISLKRFGRIHHFSSAKNSIVTCRTLIIFVILIVLLCIVYKLKPGLQPYFASVNFGSLFLGYLIYSLQLISFGIMNAQLFDSNVRQVVFTIVLYLVTINIYSYTLLWPPGIQYLLMFFFPYISGRSIFQVGTKKTSRLHLFLVI